MAFRRERYRGRMPIPSTYRPSAGLPAMYSLGRQGCRLSGAEMFFERLAKSQPNGPTVSSIFPVFSPLPSAFLDYRDRSLWLARCLASVHEPQEENDETANIPRRCAPLWHWCSRFVRRGSSTSLSPVAAESLGARASVIKPVAEKKIKALLGLYRCWADREFSTLAQGASRRRSDILGRSSRGNILGFSRLGQKGYLTPGATKLVEIGPVPDNCCLLSNPAVDQQHWGGAPGAKTSVHTHRGSETFSRAELAKVLGQKEA